MAPYLIAILVALPIAGQVQSNLADSRPAPKPVADVAPAKPAITEELRGDIAMARKE